MRHATAVQTIIRTNNGLASSATAFVQPQAETMARDHRDERLFG
jgi:hypothetical protein